ncbi:hypothetical protein GCM10023169_06160 [Georgenia halophila]|uniref:HTH luxR-type domain-containing protein n=1 Tax=Georgenia halophila TaxID=620889 RepID=A0ABP8KXH3_9MICO
MPSDATLPRPRLLAFWRRVPNGSTVLVRAPHGAGAGSLIDQWIEQTGQTVVRWGARPPLLSGHPSSPDVVVLTLASRRLEDAMAISASRRRHPRATLVVVGRHGWPDALSTRGVRPERILSGHDLRFTSDEIVALGARRGIELSGRHAERVIEATAGHVAAAVAAVEEAASVGLLTDEAVRRACDRVVARAAGRAADGLISPAEWCAFVATALCGEMAGDTLRSVWAQPADGEAMLDTLCDSGLIAASSPRTDWALAPGLAGAAVRHAETGATRSRAVRVVRQAAGSLAQRGDVEESLRLTVCLPGSWSRSLAERWRDFFEVPAGLVREALGGVPELDADPRLRLALVRALVDVSHRGHSGRIPRADREAAGALIDGLEANAAGLDPEDVAILISMRAAVERLAGRHHVSNRRLDALDAVVPAERDRAAVLVQKGLTALELGVLDRAVEAFAGSRLSARVHGRPRIEQWAAELGSVAAYLSHDTLAHEAQRDSGGGFPAHRGFSAHVMQLGLALTALDIPRVRRVIASMSPLQLDDPLTLRIIDVGQQVLAYGILQQPRRALSELELLESCVEPARFSPTQSAWMTAVRAEALLFAARHADAVELLDAASLPPEAFPNTELHRAAGLLELGRVDEAVQLAGAVHSRVRSRSKRLAIRALVLLFMTHHRAGSTTLARESLEEALLLGSRTGQLLPFAQQGLDWLGLAVAEAEHMRLDRDVRLFVAGLAQARDDLGTDRGARLTPGEARVLDALASFDSVGKLAAGLVVSPNTVKTQLRSIYRKLGVSSRAEALDVLRGDGELVAATELGPSDESARE